MDERLLSIFRGEATERLDRMVQTLLAVEAGEGDAEAIRELFRHAHSLKGTAGMVGLGDIGTVAAAVEDVLSEARTSGDLDPALAGPLLAVTDAIRGAMEGRAIDAPAIVARLRGSEALAEAPEPEPEPETPGAEPQPVAAPAPPRTNGGNGGAPPATTHAAQTAPATPPAAGLRMLRVPADRVDDLLDVAGQALAGLRQWEHAVGEHVDDFTRDALEQGETLMLGLQHAVLDLRTLPLASIVGRFPRAVRDIAAAEGKEVSLDLVGVDAQLDRAILDSLPDLIVHLLRNAVSHGIETPAEREAAGKPRAGRIVLRAESRGTDVTLTVADDGRGVEPQLLARAESPLELAELLATPGLSTADAVGDLAGRGVGLDAVRRDVEGLGGAMAVTSEPGAGSEFTLRLPATLAVLGLLLVQRGGQVFGLGLSVLEEVVESDQIIALGGRAAVDVRGEAVPLVDLADVLGMSAPRPASGPAVIVAALNRRVAVRVDALRGEREGIVKPLGPLLARVPGYVGATFLDDGSIALIADGRHIVRRSTSIAAPALDVAPAAPVRTAEAAPKVLVVDDQFTVRELQRTILTSAGYTVLTARDGREALEQLAQEPDVRLVLTDIEMPVMDGFALLLALRDDARWATLPVVVVSSRGSDEDRRRGAEAGADAYIDKAEFDQRSLLGIVQRLVVQP
jgi:two-component system chemotaxis sensor kinase CheA